MSPAAPSTLPAEDYRQRLLEGMAAAILEKGYADTTIADIVRHAHVSKRTFYEHFRDKQECLLACYAANHEDIIAVIMAQAPARQDLPIELRLRLGLRQFLTAADLQLRLMRTLMIEIMAVGREGLRIRAAAHQRFATVLLDLVERERRQHGAALRPLSPTMAMAMVGGLHELLLGALEEGRAATGKDLLEPLSEFVASILQELAVPTVR